jgi:hypothetical protein
MEGQLYQAPKIQTELRIDRFENGIFLSSDRMWAGFDNEEELHAFTSRKKVISFISKLHNPTIANNAGFFFLLSKDFGTENCKDNGLCVYLEAMGEKPENDQDPMLQVCSNMSNDDIADAWYLMSRIWTKIKDKDPSLSFVDGTWEGFRQFFILNSHEYDQE